MKRLKLYLSLTSFMCINGLAFAQVGINTENPAATLDVIASNTGANTAEGVIAPRLTGDELTLKNARYGTAQNGVFVFITKGATSAAGKTRNVTIPGYYYYDATANNGAGPNSGLWVALTGVRKEQFYMPSVVLPTTAASLPDAVNYSYLGGTFTVKLFDLYFKQYSSPQNRSNTLVTTWFTPAAEELDYFILYYDKAVFTSVTVSPTGILSYSVIANSTPSEKTFMNIMLKEK